MAKQRDPVIDSMRGIGIVLMVLGHSGFPGTDFIYLFHMALFFMLSGWLFSLRGGPAHFAGPRQCRHNARDGEGCDWPHRALVRV